MPTNDDLIGSGGDYRPHGTPLDNPAPLRVAGGAYLLPRDKAKAGPTGRPPAGYAVLGDKGVALIDGVLGVHVDTLDRLARAGRPATVCVVSHKHVAALADAKAVRHLAEAGCRFVLHRADRTDEANDLADASGFTWASPADAAAELSAAGVEVVPSRGHTIGHLSLYKADGGILLSGDAAVGDGPQDPPGTRRLVGPPAEMCEDEPAARAFWRDFDRPLSAVCPLHGTIYTDAEPDFPDLLAMLRRGDSM